MCNASHRNRRSSPAANTCETPCDETADLVRRSMMAHNCLDGRERHKVQSHNWARKNACAPDSNCFPVYCVRAFAVLSLDPRRRWTRRDRPARRLTVWLMRLSHAVERCSAAECHSKIVLYNSAGVLVYKQTFPMFTGCASHLRRACMHARVYDTQTYSRLADRNK